MRGWGWFIVTCIAFAGLVIERGWRIAVSYVALGIFLAIGIGCLRVAYDLWNAEYGHRPVADWINELNRH